MEYKLSNPTFVSHLNSVAKNINKTVKVNEFFKMTDDTKLSTAYTAFTVIKTKVNLERIELKPLVTLMRKKCEIEENYEMAAVLNHILKNYDTLLSKYVTKIGTITKQKTQT